MKKQFKTHVPVTCMQLPQQSNLITDGTVDSHIPFPFNDQDLEHEDFLRHEIVYECIADILDRIEDYFM